MTPLYPSVAGIQAHSVFSMQALVKFYAEWMRHIRDTRNQKNQWGPCLGTILDGTHRATIKRRAVGGSPKRFPNSPHASPPISFASRAESQSVFAWPIRPQYRHHPATQADVCHPPAR